MVKKLKVKTKSGKLIAYPVAKVKSVISATGYTGGLLIKATVGTFDEAKKLAKEGIITVIDLEKAIVKSVNNTNKIAMNTIQKITKRILE